MIAAATRYRVPRTLLVLALMLLAACTDPESRVTPALRDGAPTPPEIVKAPEANPMPRAVEATNVFRGMLSSEDALLKLPVLWLGPVAVAPLPQDPGLFRRDAGRKIEVEYVREIPDTGLGLWRATSVAGLMPAGIASHALELGQVLTLVTTGEGRNPVLRTQVAARAEVRPLRHLFGVARLTLLDRAFSEPLAGAALVDASGQLSGILTARPVNGFCAALSPRELEILAEPSGIGLEQYLSPAQTPTTPLPRASEALWLGMQVQELDPDLARSFNLVAGQTGLLVTYVHPDGPADKAGLKEGDLLTLLAGAPVSKVAGLPTLLADKKPGTPIAVEYLRETQSRRATILPAAKP